jgi:hypothetical protein
MGSTVLVGMGVRLNETDLAGSASFILFWFCGGCCCEGLLVPTAISSSLVSFLAAGGWTPVDDVGRLLVAVVAVGVEVMVGLGVAEAVGV